MLSPNAIRSPENFETRVAERDDWTQRTETNFVRIIRHGNNPTNYYWEVIDKLGAHFWYGGFPDGGGPTGDTFDPPTNQDGGPQDGSIDRSAILYDDDGNAYRWALSAMRDVGVNQIRYFYETVIGQRVGEQNQPLGRQLYLTKVRYTEGSPVSEQPLDAPYEVRLLRDAAVPSTPRKDVIIDARGGFIEVTSDLLRRIEVWYGGPNGGATRNYSTIVKRYDLKYTEGAFGKSLLTSVEQVGTDGVVFAKNEFTYFDDVRDGSGNYNGFDTAQSWATGDTNPELTQTLFGPQEVSALGASETNGGDFHIYLGFNISNPTKTGSFGGSLTIKGGATEGLAEFLDINGDFLPDKIFRESRGTVKFRLNQSGPNGVTTFGPTLTVANLGKLSTEWNIGVAGGPEIYFGVFAAFSIAADVTVGEDYFTDVNNDGLPDFVSAGTVYFNHLVGGIPTFSTSSAGTAVPIRSRPRRRSRRSWPMSTATACPIGFRPTPRASPSASTSGTGSVTSPSPGRAVASKRTRASRAR